MKKRLLASLLMLCIIMTLLPLEAGAANFDATSMTAVDISTGSIVIGKDGATFGAVDVIQKLDPNGYHITGRSTTNPYNILISTDTTIALDNVTINMSDQYKGNSPYNTYAILISGGANVTIYLKGANNIAAGGRFAGITVADDSSVAIKCSDHSDLSDGDPLKGKCRDANAACDPADAANTACTNTLTVSGGPNIDGELFSSGGITSSIDVPLSAPGIGGVSGYGSDVGETDMAALGFDNSGTSGGIINIEGGIITAQSAQGSSACIGSGSGADKAGTINISGGLIRAYGKGTGAGIGGGVGSDGGDITITGNAYVDADGGDGGAGIGGGGSSNWNVTAGMPSIDAPGAGGKVAIAGNAIVEACGGGWPTNVTGTAAGIGPGANNLDILNGNYTAGATVSIDKGTQVYAWSRGELPAIATVDGINHSADPANVLNHRVRETIGNSTYSYLQLFPQADNEGTSDFTGPVEAPYGNKQEKLPNKGSRNFAYTVEEAGYYSEKFSIGDASNYTPMGHVEEKTNTYYTTTGLAHQDVVFYVSTMKVEDVTVNYGESGTLTVTSQLTEPDTNPIVSYSWEIKESGTGFIELPDTDVTTYTYKPTSVESNTDYPIFRCVATLQDGTKITSNEARVYARGLDLAIRPDDVELNFGDALPNVDMLTVQYAGFINSDTVDSTEYLTGVYELWGMIIPEYVDLSSAVLEFQTADGTAVTTTNDLDAGVYNIVFKLPAAQADESLCRDYANYYLKIESGKLYYGVPSYAVTFDPKGGAMTDSTVVDVFENEFVPKPADPTRDGFAFGGWYTDDGTFANAWDFNADRVTGATTLYAKWLLGAANVTFKVENGKWADGSIVDKTVTVPLTGGRGTLAAGDVPMGMTANSGYEGGSWNVTPDTAASAVTGNVIYTYSFTKQTGGGGGGGGGTTYYTLTYETNGGNSIASERHVSGTTVKLTKTPIRTGYTFTGWYSDKALAEKTTEVKMNASKTVYAGWSASSVPDGLNGNDHFAYIIGREDGLAHPNTNITRAEVATIFYRLLDEDVRSANETTSNSFSDVSAGQWHNTAISTIAQLGIVKGRGNGIFDPDAPITRAEFAAIAARFDSETYSGVDKFPDISGHWAASFINRAAQKGWVQGDTSGNFRPDSLITRAEAITTINRVLQRLPESPSDLLSGMKTFPDNMDTAAWYYLAIQEAANGHDYDRLTDGAEKWTELVDTES